MTVTVVTLQKSYPKIADLHEALKSIPVAQKIDLDGNTLRDGTVPAVVYTTQASGEITTQETNPKAPAPKTTTPTHETSASPPSPRPAGDTASEK